MARPGRFSAPDAIGAAMELFWSKDYEATSTQDLVRAALLRALMNRVIEDDLSDPAHRGCLAINVAVEAAFREETVRTHFLRMEQAICEVVGEGRDVGELAADVDPRQAARSLLSTYYGLRVLAKVVHDRNTLTDVVECALTRLRRGGTPRPGSERTAEKNKAAARGLSQPTRHSRGGSPCLLPRGIEYSHRASARPMSAVGGLPAEPGTIIAARAVQGPAWALLFPAVLSLVMTLFEPGTRLTCAVAVWGEAGASGPTLGALVGGLLPRWLG